jgi:hypothetical protein
MGLPKATSSLRQKSIDCDGRVLMALESERMLATLWVAIGAPASGDCPQPRKATKPDILNPAIASYTT